jgi:hypothetical protein
MGQLSPDGMWRWNGTRWVPAGQPPPRRSQKWIWWLAGALAISVILIIAGVGYGAYTLVNRFQGGVFSCLPSDFPSYPGAIVAGQSTNYYGPGVPAGDTKVCRMTLIADDPIDTVSAYYHDRLESGDWILDSMEPIKGTFDFHRFSRPKTAGTVEPHQLGQQTEILIVLYS